MQHMSGGPNTALALISEIARMGIPVRLLSSDHGFEADIEKLKTHLQMFSSADESLPVEIADGSNPASPAAIGENDIFIATAWWTAQKIASVLPRMRRRSFFYLIQDFEPGLHAWSSQYALTMETYDMDIIPIINTSVLRDYFLDSRVGRFADRAFGDRSMSFEPAVDQRHFYPEPKTSGRPYRFLFYARPTIGVRNLFEIGLTAMAAAASRGAFSRRPWTVHFIGESLPATYLGSGVTIRPYPWLDFHAYARLLRQSDVLLSLMLSPHPSYGPLEMASCGGLVITNSFGCKSQERLSQYSPHILAPSPYARAIAAVIADATEMVEAGVSPSPIALPKTWRESFAPILPRIKGEWDSLQ
jgi:hypothetical protein